MSAIITVESVSKRFRTHRNRPLTLKESVLRRITSRQDPGSYHWALTNVSFSVARGRSLGIIGHNGAGKSTLLRLLCGLGRPTSGTIRRDGKVSSLLDLGSGFHADLTGRENIRTGGLLSGMTAREVRACEDEIAEFAELEEFIDQPIRTYSSGMYVRLAFATALQFDPDILVIDEVLAVGDTRFQQKCLKRMEAFHSAGKTLILTSHVPDQVRSLCDEVLVLDEGKFVMQGDPTSALRYYDDLMRQRTERRAAHQSRPSPNTIPTEQGQRQGTLEARVDTVNLYGHDGARVEGVQSGQGMDVELQYQLSKPLRDMIVSLAIYNDAHVKCFETTIPSVAALFGAPTEQGTLRCRLPELPLSPGTYYVNIGVFPSDWSYIYDYHWLMHDFYVYDEDSAPTQQSGIVSLRPNWSQPTVESLK